MKSKRSHMENAPQMQETWWRWGLTEEESQGEWQGEPPRGEMNHLGKEQREI